MQDLCEKAKKYGLSSKEWEIMSYEMDCFKVVYGYAEPDGSGVRDFAMDHMRQWEKGRHTMFRQVLGVLAETYGVCAVTSEFMERLRVDKVMSYEITWIIKELRARTYERFLFSELYKLITPEFMENKIKGSALESSFVCATIEAKRAGQLNADLKAEEWATLRPCFPPDDVSASPIAKMPPEVLQRILEYACIKNPYLVLESLEEHVYKRSASTMGSVCWDFNYLVRPYLFGTVSGGYDRLLRYRQLLRVTPELGPLLKCLTLELEDSSYANKDAFGGLIDQLLDACPNLETLVVKVDAANPHAISEWKLECCPADCTRRHDDDGVEDEHFFWMIFMRYTGGPRRQSGNPGSVHAPRMRLVKSTRTRKLKRMIIGAPDDFILPGLLDFISSFHSVERLSIYKGDFRFDRAGSGESKHHDLRQRLKLRRLKHLNLQQCYVDSKSFKQLIGMMPNLESLRLGKMTMDRGDKAGVEAALSAYMDANRQYKSVTLDDCPNLPERLPHVRAKFWEAFDEIKILRTFAFNTSLLPTGPVFGLTSLPRLRKLVLSGSLYTFNRLLTSLGTCSTPENFFKGLRELTHCLARHLPEYGNGLVPEAPDSNPVQVSEVEVLYLVEKKPPRFLIRRSFHSPGEIEPMVTTNASKTGYLFIDESLALAKDIAAKF